MTDNPTLRIVGGADKLSPPTGASAPTTASVPRKSFGTAQNAARNGNVQPVKPPRFDPPRATPAGEPFVAFAKIQAAIKGCEEEILAYYGIHPSKMKMRCPYPGHGGADDWRWDAKKAKAICTCHPKGWHDAFDVIEQMDGVSSKPAQWLRAAEILGREDLIRTRGPSQDRQRTDAKSLLSPPPGKSRSDLPRLYLAHRLGIPASDVLMPDTKVAGFSALAYYDAGTVLAGNFPCAIFSTINLAGEYHAERIYTAEHGHGKADLGRSANGSLRDPKKSAKLDKGRSKTGFCVWWGDPATAGHVIAGEGIETMAAVAFAHREEIKAKQVAVTATIATSGLQAFDPYRATTRITVAADRDEAGKASRAGEKAARTLGRRLHGKVSIGIAMPGEAGTKTDWLDVFRDHNLPDDGCQAVRNGIANAVPFALTPDEQEEQATDSGRDAQVKRAKREYPLPPLATRPLSFQWSDAHGAPWLHTTSVTHGSGGEETVRHTPVMSPLGIAARLRYLDRESAFGVRLVVEAMDGQRREIDIERDALATMGASDVRGMLLGAGLRVEPGGDTTAVDLLKVAQSDKEIAVVRKPGWHRLNERVTFVCPDGVVINGAGGDALELSMGARLTAPMARAGTLKGWTDGVAAAVGVDGCPHWAVGAMAAFAGPLINLAGLDSAGINLSGLSSGGKTTAQRLTASAWSKPTTAGDTLFQSAKATVNALELMASRANGSVLVMDELAHVSGRETAQLVYTLAGNTGKKRMDASAQARETRTWATFAVFSAETSLEEKIRKDGGEWTAGQAVRVVDIDVTGVDRTRRTEAQALDAAVKANHGHAGPAFVAALVTKGLHNDPQALRDDVNALAAEIARGRSDGIADSARVRAAHVFAILAKAGRLARDFGLLPRTLDVDRVITWAWNGYLGSSNAIALDPRAQAVGRIRQWVAERYGSTIVEVESLRDIRGSREAAGWRDGRAIYLAPNRLLEAAGNTLKEEQVAKILKDGGMLSHTKTPKHTYVDYVPGVARFKAYALSLEHFGPNSAC